jgi:hypothetical protein
VIADPFADTGSTHETTVDLDATVATTEVGAHGTAAGASTASKRLDVRGKAVCDACATALHVALSFNQLQVSDGVVDETVAVCK